MLIKYSSLPNNHAANFIPMIGIKFAAWLFGRSEYSIKRFHSILWWKLQKWEKSDQNSWGSYVLDDFGTTSDLLDGLRYGLHTI